MDELPMSLELNRIYRVHGYFVPFKKMDMSTLEYVTKWPGVIEGSLSNLKTWSSSGSRATGLQVHACNELKLIDNLTYLQ